MKTKDMQSIEVKKASVVLAKHYHIALDRIADHRELVCWMVHLAEKRWVTADLVREFAFTVCEEKGWKPPFL